MKRRYARVLAFLAATAMATVIANGTCTIGNSPDVNPDCLFFCDRTTEKFQGPASDDTPLPWSETGFGMSA
jgi:hypothetical protein